MKNKLRKISGCRRSAFTLIELLVVISIIALLVSILLPSLNIARKMAKDVACLATLKSIGLGWQMYWTENNPSIPVAPPMPENATTENSIVYVLTSYVPAGMNWRCPSGEGDEKYRQYGTSYEFMAGYVVDITPTIRDRILPSIIKIVDDNPAKYPIFADAGVFHTKDTKNTEGKMASYHDGHSEILDMTTAKEVILPMLAS